MFTLLFASMKWSILKKEFHGSQSEVEAQTLLVKEISDEFGGEFWHANDK